MEPGSRRVRCIDPADPVAPSRAFWRGAAEAIGTMAAFLVIGLGWAALAADPVRDFDARAPRERGAAAERLAYLASVMSPEDDAEACEHAPRPAPDRQTAPTGAGPYKAHPGGADAPSRSGGLPRVILVDGYNTLCAGLLGGRSRERWWSGEQREALLERAAAFEGLREAGAELWVVFDGPDEREDLLAANLRSRFAPSADDWLLAELSRRAAEPVRRTLVTSDRRLARRARKRGAEVIAPADFLAACRPATPTDAPS